MKKVTVRVFAAIIFLATLAFLVQPTSTAAAQAFIKPAPGVYSSDFGMRKHPLTGQYTMHYGVDIAGNDGATISASASGTVVSVVRNSSGGGLGEHVVIRHNIAGQTYITVYAHMRAGSASVTTNSTVSQGQAIGIVGRTGNVTGPHLHFELYKGSRTNANAVDPKPYITGQINPTPPATPHAYDGTWATVIIKHPTGGSTANLFANVGYGIIDTLPVGNGYKVYGKKEFAANGDMYYNVGPGYIHSAYGIIKNHRATVTSSISTYTSPNGAFNRTLSPGTFRVHAAKDGWYDLGNNTWVKANQVIVTKQ